MTWCVSCERIIAWQQCHQKRGVKVKTIWRVYVDYGSGYGYVPVSWAPTFDTKEEANEWINDPSHDWVSYVRAIEEEVEVEEV